MAKAINAPKRVSVTVPRGSANEDQNVFISINGVNYLLPKGRTSEVPAAVADEYRRSEMAKEKYYAAAEALQERCKG